MQTSLYHLPSQSHEVFEKFADNFEINLDKITNKNTYWLVILGDFNAKSSNKYKHDATTYKGPKIDAITSQFGLQQNFGSSSKLSSSTNICKN